MNSDIFNFIPDFDGDGDHDVVDFLIMDDIIREDEEEEKPSDTDFLDDEDEEDY